MFISKAKCLCTKLNIWKQIKQSGFYCRNVDSISKNNVMLAWHAWNLLNSRQKRVQCHLTSTWKKQRSSRQDQTDELSQQSDDSRERRSDSCVDQSQVQPGNCLGDHVHERERSKDDIGKHGQEVRCWFSCDVCSFGNFCTTLHGTGDFRLVLTYEN